MQEARVRLPGGRWAEEAALDGLRGPMDEVGVMSRLTELPYQRMQPKDYSLIYTVLTNCRPCISVCMNA